MLGPREGGHAAPPDTSAWTTGDWLADARERGLFRVGLPAPYGTDGGYRAIATAAADLMAASGRTSVAMSFAVRQLVGRFFVAENGSAEQKDIWLPRLAAGDVPTSIAISEAGAGAHPKLLKTRADAVDGGYRITGEKAWVTNAPVAQLIVVVAIIGEDNGRKRYGAFLVPRETQGLSVKAGADEGRHGAHCPVVLDGCVVPRSALLEPGGDAYAKLALPFRTLEDSIATSVQAAALRLLLKHAAPSVPADGQAELGALIGLTSLVQRGAEAAAAALDGGQGHDTAALVGVRLLAGDIIPRIKALPGGGPTDTSSVKLLAEIEAMENVARRARLAYQERLAGALIDAARQTS